MRRLEGRVVATTRDGRDDDRLGRALREEGARVVVWPTIAVREPEDARPLAAALKALPTYDWIVFTSARAVDAVARRHAPPPRATRVAAVGPATAAALTERGWAVAAVGDGGAERLAGVLAQRGVGHGTRVLFPAGSLAADTLEDALRALGAEVDRVHAYTTEPAPLDGRAVRTDLAAGVDVVTFASPSAVRSLADALDGELAAALASCTVVAIGPTTAEQVRALGVPGVRIADEPALDALVDACAFATGATGTA